MWAGGSYGHQHPNRESIVHQFTLTIRFLTPCVAPVDPHRPPNCLHQFNRVEPDVRDPDWDIPIVWNKQWWFAPMMTACRRWQLCVDLSSVEFGASALAGEIIEVDNPVGDVDRDHEAIPANGILTFNVVLIGRVTERDLRKVLERVGEYVGFSPHGYAVGCGRFTVEALVPVET